ncbi:TetR/AcrR family transcriptional regulator [Gephyromycinifex aptenodytis]|uniref:TetR/AcrR family transcriptional regulator n=1 Tax=Gephyromycinifex aptenodytis TaxID=2716227 RepID=UPI001B2FF85B|nr:TetR/AcrR family transcriptional regulator [Gephyromycinifex aptenodytis]
MNIGGRPPQITSADIERAGRAIGLRRLSLNAVAQELGVTATALYRHVENRMGLERLVGESILAELELLDDPALDDKHHLLAQGLRLYEFTLAHPGLASYMQTLFPRGEGGRRLLADATRALHRRGYDPAVAMVLSSAVAILAIGYAAAADERRVRADVIEQELEVVTVDNLADEGIGQVLRVLPQVEDAEYVRLWLGAAINGFLQAAQPGQGVTDLLHLMRADVARPHDDPASVPPGPSSRPEDTSTPGLSELS